MNYPPFDRRYLEWLQGVNGRRPQGWLDPWVERDGLDVPALQPLEDEGTGAMSRFRRWFG